MANPNRPDRAPMTDDEIRAASVTEPPRQPEIERYLTFRDRLRSDPADRERYQRVKRELAQRDWKDVQQFFQNGHRTRPEMPKGAHAHTTPG